MPQELPLFPSDPNYSVITALAGIPYVLDVRWNTRGAAWYLGIRDESGSAIRVGIRVVLGVMLGRRSVDPRFPPGFIFAADTSNRGEEADLDSLGSRVKVYFYTFAEWTAAIA